MGYYTTYSLKWEPQFGYKSKPNCECSGKPKTAKYCPQCGAGIGSVSIDNLIGPHIERNPEMEYCLDADGSSNEAGKWYNHEKDMREMSLSFPNVLFILSGEGEESGDVWRKYFLNGKMQLTKIKMEFESFDESKLV